jgi:curved DNA-binding protein CbpA
MASYYEILGVAADAPAPAVKAGYEGRLKALARAGAPPARRDAQLKLLHQAYVVLSNPAKRAWYDRKLAEAAEPPAKSRAPWAIAAALVLAIAAGGWYATHRAPKDPQAAEREREGRLAKAREERAKGADWNKTLNDSKRIEEMSRRRAQAQRARAGEAAK